MDWCLTNEFEHVYQFLNVSSQSTNSCQKSGIHLNFVGKVLEALDLPVAPIRPYWLRRHRYWRRRHRHGRRHSRSRSSRGRHSRRRSRNRSHHRNRSGQKPNHKSRSHESRDNFCRRKSDGFYDYKYPLITCSNKFRICLNGKLSLANCLDGQYFNQTTGNCSVVCTAPPVPPENPSALDRQFCYDNTTSNWKVSGAYPLGNCSREFYICIDGDATFHNCLSDEIFVSCVVNIAHRTDYRGIDLFQNSTMRMCCPTALSTCAAGMLSVHRSSGTT